MGNTTDWVIINHQFACEDSLTDQLTFLDQSTHPNQLLQLPSSHLYRFRQSPYELVMNHTKTFTCDNPKYEEYASAIKNIGNLMCHKNIAKISSICISKKTNLCMKETQVMTYVNYYSITLMEVIEERKKKDIRFTTGEMWYLLNTLIELSLYLKKLSIYFGIYLPKNIFMSSEGYIKIYLFHTCSSQNFIQNQPTHFLYYHAVQNIANFHQYLPLPPETLIYLAKEAIDFKEELNFELFDVFGIGMIAMEAMLFNTTKKYYQYSSGKQLVVTFDQSLLQKDLKELKSIYPASLMSLMQRLIDFRPANRYNLQQARDYIANIREDISMNGSIKMYEDEDNKILPKLSYHSLLEQEASHHILRQIMKGKETKLEIQPLKNMKLHERRDTNQNTNLQNSVKTHGSQHLRTNHLGMSLMSKNSQKSSLGCHSSKDREKMKSMRMKLR